ncbi:MAG: diacylglycerol kinase family protein [Actinomycetales bacterium]
MRADLATLPARLSRERLAPVAIGFVVATAALAVAVALRWAPVVDLDQQVASAAREWVARHPWVLASLREISVVLGPATWRASVVVGALGLALRGHRKPALWALVVLGIGVATEALLKLSLARPRPPDPFDIAAGYSWPSGHATASLLSALELLVIAWPFAIYVARRWLPWLAGLLVLVTGIDRLLLGVHYLSDVVGGWLLAASVATTAGAVGGVDRWLARMPWSERLAAAPLPLPERRQQRLVAVVVNPTKAVDTPGNRRLISNRVQRAGWLGPLWLETTPDDSGAGQARQAVAAGAGLVLTVGGDGTVRNVCDALAGGDVPMGILPGGTGNLLARNLGIPWDDLEGALDVALHGARGRIDLLRVTGDDPDSGKASAVMAGLGLDALIVRDAPEEVKRRLGPAAYVVSGSRHWRARLMDVQVTIDDQPPVRRSARTVLVGNVGELTAGLRLLPDARPDDGQLDVVVVAPRRVADWGRLAVRVAARRAEGEPGLLHLSGRRVLIQARGVQARQVDGDAISDSTTLQVEVEPQAVPVMLPLGSPFWRSPEAGGHD